MAPQGLAILNPVAGRGRALSIWRELGTQVARRFPGVELFRTGGPGEAERRAAEWVAAGETGPVIVIGGDGTV
ncbi:MAG TPA: diacylglycerol kinase family protein, partial [Gemmatimonadales bacterium]